MDLDLGKVGTVRIGTVGLREGRTRIQFRRIHSRTLRQIGEADRAIGAGDSHEAIADLEVAGAGLQRLGRDLLQLAAEVAGGAFDADAADLQALSQRLFESDEAREGILSFLEKRPPAWAIPE